MRREPNVVISVYAFFSAIAVNAIRTQFIVFSMWACAKCLVVPISMCLMIWLERNTIFDTNKHFSFCSIVCNAPKIWRRFVLVIHLSGACDAANANHVDGNFFHYYCY